MLGMTHLLQDVTGAKVVGSLNSAQMSSPSGCLILLVPTTFRRAPGSHSSQKVLSQAPAGKSMRDKRRTVAVPALTHQSPMALSRDIKTTTLN